MKIQFLGTAAAEGIPALFCTCDNCRKSRLLGERGIRTRSQALIDDQLLLDFPADTYMHMLNYQLDMTRISNCLITHNHSDHLYPKDIFMLAKGFSHMPEDYCLHFYGTEVIGEQITPIIEERLVQDHLADFHAIAPFHPFACGTYQVTALPAIHDAKSGPVFYQVSSETKTLLYAHDTHYFHDSVWEYWQKTRPHFDLVSLDCTNACLPLTYIGHMGLDENANVRERMLEEGYADEQTLFVCNHFSHNGTHVVYDEFVPIAHQKGFLTSYDGLTLEF